MILKKIPNIIFLILISVILNALVRLFQKDHFDAVIHFAAESHVDRSIENPMAFIQTNVVGTANLLGASLESLAKSGC